MKKWILLFLVIFLVGCDMSSFNDTNEEVVGCPISFECESGNSGVEMTILSPNEDVKGGDLYVEGQSFVPAVNVQDLGQSDAEGEICVTGLDTEFSGFSGCDCEDYYIVVSEDDEYYENDQIVDFTPGYKVPQDKSGEYVSTFVNRYMYSTYGIVDVCIKQISTTRESKGSCEGTQDNILDVSSSGPLKIKTVSQRLSRLGSDAVSLTLTYELEETGKGNVVNENAFMSGSCFYTSDEGKKVKVSFNLFDEEYSCGFVEMEDGKGEGSCLIEDISVVGGSEEYLFQDEKEQKAYLITEYVWEETESVMFRVE
ncbi:MAG: hypothetical protein ABIJ18_00090 [archaeon]